MNMYTPARGRSPIRLACERGVLALALVIASSCIGDRPRRCETQRDCAGEQSLCSTRGFCQNECSQDSDCPCGSYCATSCGACMRSDNTGAATCFASENGLSVSEVFGACSASLKPPTSQRQDAGACTAPLPPLMCTTRVTQSVLRDAGAPEPTAPAPTTMVPVTMPPASLPDAGDAGGLQ